MSPDEIAALFASNDNNADKVEEPAEETVEPENIPEPVEEPEAVKKHRFSRKNRLIRIRH